MGRFQEYQVIGRKLPSEKEPQPKLYRMRIFAPNEVVAKSRFWYFLRKLRKVKKATGEVVAVNVVSLGYLVGEVVHEGIAGRLRGSGRSAVRVGKTSRVGQGEREGPAGKCAHREHLVWRWNGTARRTGYQSFGPSVDRTPPFAPACRSARRSRSRSRTSASGSATTRARELTTCTRSTVSSRVPTPSTPATRTWPPVTVPVSARFRSVFCSPFPF